MIEKKYKRFPIRTNKEIDKALEDLRIHYGARDKRRAVIRALEEILKRKIKDNFSDKYPKK